MVASWGLATVSQQELWRLLHLFIFLCLAAVSFLTTLKNMKVQASQSAGGEEHKGKTAETFFSFVFSVIKHQSICVLKLCAVFAFYTCDSQNCSSLTTRLIQTDGNCRLDETLGGVPLLPSSLLHQHHRNCSLMQNMLSWCLRVSSEPSQRFNNTKYCTSSTLPLCLPLPPSLLFLIGSHLCILVTQSAPSPPEPAGQEAQALRVPTAGV